VTGSEQPTILVAEDDRDALGVVAYGLEREGYRVLAARDGEEALRLALVVAPDLAILDVMMPGVDGYEVTRRLREHAPTSGTPIVLLTARAGEQDAARGYEAGADLYMKKPFSPVELRERVRDLLAGGSR
jgi:DNA-binding response OmpR family regulator